MKTVCVPLTLEAMKLLDTNCCPDLLLESISLTTEEYDQLFKSGAIENINKSLKKMIDDYEDEAIENIDDLRKILSILEAHLTPSSSPIIN